MTAAIAEREWLAVPALAGCALLFGAVVALAPLVAAGTVAVAIVVLLAFWLPVAHLTVLVLLTAVVPFTVQNTLSGGPGAGLFLSDVLLASGLLRSGLVLLQRPSDRRRLAVVGLTLVFLVGVLAQLLHGIAANGNISQAGGEARALLGFGTVLITLPLLDDARSRARLGRGLALVGLVLGMWGIVQWALGIDFGGTGDVGVRAGVSDTTAGRGQLQGGLFGFPVAVILAAAALICGQRMLLRDRLALFSIAMLNVVCVLLTYERTFWVATMVGLALVIVSAGRMQRLKGAAWTAIVAAATFAALTTLAPGTMTAARERFLSLGQYANSASLKDRRVESRYVVEEISRRPVMGSGLGAEIFWGRAWIGQAPSAVPYAHNGYLVLLWKLGAMLATVLFCLLGWAIVGGRTASRRAPPDPLAIGARGALLAVVIVSVTFPAFATLAITGVMGVLLAFAFSDRRADLPGPAHRAL